MPAAWGESILNKRNFIISTGAVLALALLATCYAAFTAIRSETEPNITEEYRQEALSSQGNPILQIGNSFAELFIIIGERLTGS